MSKAITVRDLSKRYIISHDVHEASSTLVETLSNQMRLCKRKMQRMLKGDFSTPKNLKEPFWALKDLNFDIEQGDRVGIIGRNGAGKSTLLKLISRITIPTKGSITMNGRVSSLLEVGTGFHHELTGRENIYLNGSILGMRHREINRRFDEIVAFSGIEQFLDTPVKRYSSGMFARLGFAIAAHLHSDILIVDEVLAVGDQQFQKKCLAKLGELGQSGRTVLFVSHSISSVLTLCNKGIYLERGALRKIGTIEECADLYADDMEKKGPVWDDGYGDQTIYFNRIEILPPPDGRTYFLKGEKVIIAFDANLLEVNPNLYMGIKLFDSHDQFLAQSFYHDEYGDQNVMKETGRHRIEFALETHEIYEGEYLVKIEVGILHERHVVHDSITLKFSMCEPTVNRFSESLSKGKLYLGPGWRIQKQ